LRIRLSAIARHYGTTFDELKANGFRFKSFAGEDAILGALNRNGRIEPTALYNQLYEQAGDLKPKHIGIDTSADVFAGNEIDRAQVRQFISLLRRLAIVANGSVVLLSHPSLTGISSGSGLSGSTAWHNSVRSRIYMTSPKPEAGEQPDSDLREIKFKKANYSAVANSLVVRYRSGVFVPEGAMTTIEMAAREAEVEDTFISIVRELEAVGQELSAAESRGSAVAAVAKHPDVPKGMRRPEFVTAQAKLLERGRLRIETLRSGTTREKKVIKTA
jgi:RecA-family ATPase